MTSLIDLVPKPLALVALVHAGASFGMGSVFAERQAEWVHIPACQVRLASAEAGREFSALSEAERKRRIVSGIFRQFPQLGELPMMRELKPLIAQRPKQRRPTDFTSHCACLADAAIRETRLDHAIWVGSLRTYTPSGVSRFPGVMSRMDRTGVCGTNGG